jgi:hypothetical protein
VVNSYAVAAPVVEQAAPAPAAKAGSAVPTSADPVTIAGRLENGRLIIDADILKGWHIYAYVGKDNPFVQTEMVLDLPEGAVSDKEWQSSAGLPFPGNDGIFVYEGKVRFSLAVDCSRVKPGSTIRCGLYYQVCDNTKCFPPKRKTVDIIIKSV